MMYFSECVPIVLYFNIGKASETCPKLLKLFNGLFSRLKEPNSTLTWPSHNCCVKFPLRLKPAIEYLRGGEIPPQKLTKTEIKQFGIV